MAVVDEVLVVIDQALPCALPGCLPSGSSWVFLGGGGRDGGARGYGVWSLL